jgi:hypothetical protein
MIVSEKYYGFPGPGGSPGMCPICGVNFLLEILLGKKVKSFRINLSEQTFFGHDKCLVLLKSLDKDDRWWERLPERAPFRREAERQGWGKAPEPCKFCKGRGWIPVDWLTFNDTGDHLPCQACRGTGKEPKP